MLITLLAFNTICFVGSVPICIFPVFCYVIPIIFSGELTTKHSLQGYGRAVLSYAQYKQAGSLLPNRYDETVSRRWGVELQVGSPIMSLAILVPIENDKTPGKVKN